MKKTMHCYVSGRVQGVCFRMATREQAMLQDITGWVRNLPDGRVEVMASGDAQQIQQMKEWLRQGPDLARVTDISVEELEHQEFEGFTVR